MPAQQTWKQHSFLRSRNNSKSRRCQQPSWGPAAPCGQHLPCPCTTLANAQWRQASQAWCLRPVQRRAPRNLRLQSLAKWVFPWGQVNLRERHGSPWGMRCDYPHELGVSILNLAIWALLKCLVSLPLIFSWGGTRQTLGHRVWLLRNPVEAPLHWWFCTSPPAFICGGSVGGNGSSLNCSSLMWAMPHWLGYLWLFTFLDSGDSRHIDSLLVLPFFTKYYFWVESLSRWSTLVTFHEL